MPRIYNRYTITPKGSHRFVVYGCGRYPRHSVLAGQDMKVYIETYSSLEEAQQAWPEARLSNKWIEPQVSLNHLPN